MMRQILLYIFILLVCSVSAEQFRITGKVICNSEIGEINEPMIGATVEVKGSDRRTATDIDGNFSIEVEKGQILRFSYVGYHSKEVEVLNDSSLVIELEEDTSRCLSDDFDYSIGQGPSLCPCLHHRNQRNRTPKSQNSVINH